MLLQYAGLVLLLSCCFHSSAGGSGATNDGEKAMQQLETAEVKLEQKLSSMMTELGTQLKQAEETQLPLKRKKREAKKSEEEVERGGARLGENPMAKYSLEDFVGVLKSMRSLRVAFDDLMESYRVYKNNQEADKVVSAVSVVSAIGDGDDKEDDDDNEDDDDKEDEDDDGGDEPEADEKSEEDDESKEDDEDEVDKEGGDDGKDDGEDDGEDDEDDNEQIDDDEGSEPSETKEGQNAENVDDRHRRMKRMKRHRRRMRHRM